MLFEKNGYISVDMWQKFAKENGLPQPLKARFGSWMNFKNQVSLNHKVKTIGFFGYEDVYNITVDDHHNYNIITSFEDDKYVVSSGICVKNCGEISLKNCEKCNLCEINSDNLLDQHDLNERAKIAAFIGTLQASYTDFHYLRAIWQKNCEKEALLGIGMTRYCFWKSFKVKYERSNRNSQARK